MASTQSISFATRDGISLEGYLTLPPGASKEAPPRWRAAPRRPWCPLDLMFDREVQFLASRGYAVLQPNYRAVNGYSPSISSTYHTTSAACMTTSRCHPIRAAHRSGGSSRTAIMGGRLRGYLALTRRRV